MQGYIVNMNLNGLFSGLHTATTTGRAAMATGMSIHPVVEEGEGDGENHQTSAAAAVVVARLLIKMRIGELNSSHTDLTCYYFHKI